MLKLKERKAAQPRTYDCRPEEKRGAEDTEQELAWQDKGRSARWWSLPKTFECYVSLFVIDQIRYQSRQPTNKQPASQLAPR
jgi:hypothetical protein